LPLLKFQPSYFENSQNSVLQSDSTAVLTKQLYFLKWYTTDTAEMQFHQY